MEKFKGAGLADHVKSWVGIGPNKDVSGEQVEAAVGSNKIAELAHSSGLDKSALLSKITSFLPMIVDKLTPTGEVPHDGLVGQALDALKKHLPGGGGK